MRKPKTPLLSFLHRTFKYALIADAKGDDYAAELREKHEAQQYSRREFLAGAVGSLAAGGLIPAMAAEPPASQILPRVAIVGAGIAGLNAAYHLNLANPRFSRQVRLYEAGSDNSWGRIRTLSRENGLTAELGGEFIDTGHAEMHWLVKKFGLKLHDLRNLSTGLVKDSYFINGRHYGEPEVLREFKKFARFIAEDATAYEADDSGQDAIKLDEKPLQDYFKSRLALHESDWIYQMLDAAYTGEFGLEIGDQSALNFITMIGTDTKSFEIFGESDERFRIIGGNEQLIHKLRCALPGQIETNRQLKAIRQKGQKYSLSFERGDDVEAEFVILALPFKTLRNVDLNGLELPDEKKKAIKELSYGTNAKLLLSVASRVWRQGKPRRAGNLFNEAVHNGWDNSQGQNADRGPGGYTVYLGGKAGKNLGRKDADRYITELERAFPGFRSKVNPAETLSINWSQNEFTKASYASYSVGQWTTISGNEFTPVGNLFFCGEHCSSDAQGYMEGGAETGRRAAEKLLEALKPVKTPGRARRR